MVCGTQRNNDAQESSFSSHYYIPGGFDDQYDNEYRERKKSSPIQQCYNRETESPNNCKCGEPDAEYIPNDCCKSFEDRHLQDAMNHGFHKGLLFPKNCTQFIDG